MIKIIGNTIYVQGYRAGTINENIPPTVREWFEEHLNISSNSLNSNLNQDIEIELIQKDWRNKVNELDMRKKQLMEIEKNIKNEVQQLSETLQQLP